MLIEKFAIGQIFYQAQILVNGQDVDDHEGEYFTTIDEAEADGQCLVKEYDPEWQKRNPGCVEYYVRQLECLSVDDHGMCDSAITVSGVRS